MDTGRSRRSPMVPDEPLPDDLDEIEPIRTDMHVFNRDQRVIVTFNPAPDQLVLPPGDALRLGKELVARAQRAMRGRSGRVPRS
jgi:hypothetical protein